MGLYPTRGGKIIKNGEEMPLNNPREMLKHDVAFLSEDRKGVGLLLDEPIDYNIAYTSMEIQEKFIKNLGPIKLMDKRDVESHAQKMIEDMDIRCTSSKQHTRYLSGGETSKRYV